MALAPTPLAPQATRRPRAARPNFGSLLARFDPISLDQMANVALLNRTDTKYVLSEGQLYRALARLAGQYRVLEVASTRLNRYQTLYFDTADLALYRRHHNGLLNRHKVRSRVYVDSRLAFLEVKLKTNKRRTIKRRLKTPQVVTALDASAAGFVHAHYPYDARALAPRLWNTFTRITLVSTRRVERLTLDFDLRFHDDRHAAALPGIAVAEVKQEGFTLASDFIGQMRALNRRPCGFSKYCMGVNLLYPTVKNNNFKPRLLLVNRLARGERDDGRVH